jgi:hypothetical protein
MRKYPIMCFNIKVHALIDKLAFAPFKAHPPYTSNPYTKLGSPIAHFPSF